MSRIIGRGRYARETYPGSRASAPILARNFASGPKDQFDIPNGGGSPPWALIDSVQPWASTVTYALGDIVAFDDTTYISLQAGNLNNTPPLSADPPTAFWQQNVVVPITPISTGIVIVHAEVSVSNGQATPERLNLNVAINGIALPEPVPLVHDLQPSPNGQAVVSILAEGKGLPLGIRADVSLVLSSTPPENSIALVGGDTTIEVREMQAATG